MFISHFKELQKHQTLLWALVRRHVASRYRGSTLGFLWSLLNPLCLMGIYTLVFQYYLKSNAVEHYPLFLFSGLLPWLWTVSALSEGTSSISSSGHLVTKSLFPAHILILVPVLTSFVHFLLSLPIYFIALVFVTHSIPLSVIFLPMLMLIHGIFLYGLVLAFASINVTLRDMQHLVANILSFLFFLSPIVYPPQVVPERFSFLLSLNPFALFTQAYHEVLFYGGINPEIFIPLIIVAGLALMCGIVVYNSKRERFAEGL